MVRAQYEGMKAVSVCVSLKVENSWLNARQVIFDAWKIQYNWVD